MPRVNPIPRNVVGLIGGTYGSDPTFVLSLNGKEIVIQAPPDPSSGALGRRTDFDESNPLYEWYMTERSQKIYAHYMEIIQSLLSEVGFGKTNWAYLTFNNRRGYQITQRKRRIPRPTCPPWGPLIHESEVEYTVYGLAGDRRGIWKGKEVGECARWNLGVQFNKAGLDVMVGWDERHMDDVDRAMKGYRLLEGFDLTFEFYGHLIGSDGEIKGIVSEAAWGRMITCEDFSRVHQAIVKVQKRGLLYRAVLTNRFMVANNKVRLLDLSMIDTSCVSRPDELEKRAEVWHWRELSQLFYEIRSIGPYGDFRIPFSRFVTSHEDLQCLPFLPSPEFPLGGIMLYPDFFRAFLVDPWPEYVDIWENFGPNGSEEMEAPLNRKLIYRDPPRPGISARRGLVDDIVPVTRLVQSRHLRRITRYPYLLPKHKRLLVNRCADTGGDSDTTASS